MTVGIGMLIVRLKRRTLGRGDKAPAVARQPSLRSSHQLAGLIQKFHFMVNKFLHDPPQNRFHPGTLNEKVLSNCK